MAGPYCTCWHSPIQVPYEQPEDICAIHNPQEDARHDRA